MNIAEVILKLQDIVDSPFDSNAFALQLIEAYAPPKATLAKLRQGTLNKAERENDLLWTKKIHCRVALPGKASEELDILREVWAAKKNTPRFLLATDGFELAGIDTKLDDPLSLSFSSLVTRYDFFLPLAGVERYKGVPDSPADIKAAGSLAKFYDAILEANPDWTGHQRVHEINLFLTRILFCLFAQSTGIFRKNLFTETLSECTSIDGADMSAVMKAVFEGLDIPELDRGTMPEFAKRFPYVNGGLFRDRLLMPSFSRIARRILLDTARLNWAEINPDIFGSMIQAVVKPEMRGELGMHYTSVPNIMKVLRPLFLDRLEAEVNESGGNAKRLDALLTRIRKIRVFDPACGSGNFLIIAYKELCKLEMHVFEMLRACNKQFRLPFSQIQLENFRGIEYEDFAVETAKLSLYIAQHQMNVLFRNTFGFGPPDLPLRDSGRVVQDNATRLDWKQVCPIDPDGETYLVGNPPYLGHAGQSSDQKEDMRHVLGLVGRSFEGGDYVKCWLIKGALYCSEGNAELGLVTTNSICQGEQVQAIWPIIHKLNVEVGFTHEPFKWKNNASKNAGVTCVVVGLRGLSSSPKRIYGNQTYRTVRNISPYLVEGDNTIVVARQRPLSNLPKMLFGNMARDEGHLILSPEQRRELCSGYPSASQFLRRLYGSQEFIKGIERWCLWIEPADVEEALSIPPIAKRIAAVKRFRLKSPKDDTVQFAKNPHRFVEIRGSGKESIIIPTVSSEKRQYLPVGIVDAAAIVTNLAFAIYEPSMYLLGILSSRLHLVWATAVSGKLEERLRYSNTLVWNTFPLPELSQVQKDALEEAAWVILGEREKHAGRTIAYLYDPETMPPALLAAHREADHLIEVIYNGKPFSSDTERLEHLFKRYKLLVAKEMTPRLIKEKGKPRKVSINA